MQLTINGEKRQFEQVQTALDLVQQMNLENKRIALELNQNIVPKSLYAKTRLIDGDVLEIVVAVGGG